ncbi:MAG: arginine--tRNA ligase [Nitrososphaeria archaeon]
MISFLTKVAEVESAIREAVQRISPEVKEFYVGEPTEKGFGDVTTNVAFLMAKALRRPPSQIAQELLGQININREEINAEAHRSGFINFTFTNIFYFKFVKELIDRGGFGEINVGPRKRIIIEHTSVNPNKALHVGHARNVVLGDAFYRLFKRVGHEVTVLNYIDDTGVQVADLIVGFKYLGFPTESDLKYDHYCGDVVYVNANRAIEENEELKKMRSQVLKDLEKGGEIYAFAQNIINRIVKEQLRSAWRIGARYDLLNWESHFVHGGYWNKMFEVLKEKGLLKFVTEGKYKNCWVLLDRKILVRSDGTAVYTAKDLTYAAWKLGIIKDDFFYKVYEVQPDGTPLYTTDLSEGEKGLYRPADETYILIDQRQLPLQELIKETLGALSGKMNYNVIAYGLVALSKNTAEKVMKRPVEKEFVHMSGRSGIYYNLDDLMDAIKGAALKIVNERNPGLENKEEVAEKVAVAAIRYSLVRPDLDKQIVFDIDEALKLEGDTGPYIQYSYARAVKILEKAGEQKLDLAPIALSPEERDLALQMSKLDYVINKALRSLSITTIASYTHDLAFKFNVFYEKRRVLDEPNPETKKFRLALVLAFKMVISDAMQILGLPLTDEL